MAEDPDATPTQREIARLDDAIDKVVVSDSLDPEDTAPWSDTLILRGGEAHQKLAELKEQPGEDILVFGSRTLWSDLLGQGLVDELHLMIGPVVVGEGTPVFDEQPPLALQLDAAPRTWEDSANVLVRYDVQPQER